MRKRKALLVLGMIWAIFSFIFLIEFIANTAYNFTYNMELISKNMAFSIFQICIGSIFYIGNIVVSILTTIFCHKSKKFDNEALSIEKEAKERKRQQKLSKLKNKIDKLEN